MNINKEMITDISGVKPAQVYEVRKMFCNLSGI